MKKLLLLLILFIGLSVSTTAQRNSSYSSGRYYQTCGNTWTQTTINTEWSSYYGQYVNVRYCRKVTWHRQWREGYTYNWVYYNGRYRWQSSWYRGYSWYYTWSSWYRC